MVVSRDQELWAIALDIERRLGADGPRYIAEQIGRLALEQDPGGVDLWAEVARRYETLMARRFPN